MKFNLKTFFGNFKEYIILSSFILLSLILLNLNSNNEIVKFKTIAFGTFAAVNSLVPAFIDIFSDSDQLIHQKKLNAKLMLENSLLISKAAENERLRKLLQFKEGSGYPLIAAKVISKMGSVFKGQLIINVGLNDNVKKGMPVITEDGLLGVISDISDDYSLVTHLFNTDLSVAVTIRETNTEGILNWDGQNLLVKNVPTTTAIKQGNSVYSSDYSTILPPEIPVGYVGRIESSVPGLLKNIKIIPRVDIYSAGDVFVLQVIEEELNF